MRIGDFLTQKYLLLKNKGIEDQQMNFWKLFTWLNFDYN